MRWPVNARWNDAAIAAALREDGGLAQHDIERCLAGGFGIEAFLTILTALETAAHSPVTQTGVQVRPAVIQDGVVTFALALPSFLPNSTMGLAEWLVSAINLRQSTQPPARLRAMADAVNARLKTARDLLQAKLSAGGVNTVRIARRASTSSSPTSTATCWPG